MRLGSLLKDGSCGNANVEIAGIAYDSRAVRQGYAFFAIAGTALDGRKFIPDAIAKGAVAVVTEEGGGAPLAVPDGIALAIVPDARRALSRASDVFYKEPSKSLTVVGVTGTKGKTTTCHMVKAVMDACGEKTGLIGTIHNIVGNEERPVTRTTPESADLHALMGEMLTVGSTAVTMEVSSHALVLKRAEDIRFSAGVLTNIGRDHLDFHGTVEKYAEAKRHLFEMLGKGGVAVLNLDEPFYPLFREACRVPTVTYGLSAGAEVTAEDLRMDGSGSSFTLRLGRGREAVRLRLPGRFNVYNALAAASAAYGLGKDSGQIAAGLSAAERVRGRVEVVEGPGDFTVWVDYAHTPESLQGILSLAREVSRGRVIAVFGCGGDRDTGKRPVMGRIAADLADHVVITDDNPRTEDQDHILNQIEEGIGQSSRHPGFTRLKDRREAIHRAVDLAGPDDIVVVAGKGHETYQQFKEATVDFDDVLVAREAMNRRAGIEGEGQ